MEEFEEGFDRMAKHQDPDIAFYCDECGRAIRSGDWYIEVGDCRYCENCFRYKEAD